MMNSSSEVGAPGTYAGLLGIGAEILSMIMETLQATSPGKSHLSSICLAHSRLRAIARRIQARHLDLVVQGENELQLVRLLRNLEEQKLETAVQHLRVYGVGREPRRAFIDALVSLIPRMSGLQSLTWSTWTGAPIPADVVAVLGRHPQIKLHLWHTPDFRLNCTTGEPDEKEDPALKAVVGLGNLASLALKHQYTNAAEARWVTHPLKKVLLGCPNLRSLELAIDMPRSGCVSIIKTSVVDTAS
jgi:hypothetical protein